MNGGHVAGMAWRDVAASAYRAYAASTGKKNYQGLPMPEFDALPQSIQTAWEASVRQAHHCLEFREDAGGEERWAGWVPPHLK